jgi:hypothetical protein
MLQFLFVCYKLLSDSSDDYSTDEGVTTQLGSASTRVTRSTTEGTSSACLGRMTCHPHTLGKRESRVRPRPLLGVTWPTLNSSTSYTPSSERNNNDCNSFDRFSKGKQLVRFSTKVHAPRHATFIVV